MQQIYHLFFLSDDNECLDFYIYPVYYAFFPNFLALLQIPQYVAKSILQTFLSESFEPPEQNKPANSKIVLKKQIARWFDVAFAYGKSVANHKGDIGNLFPLFYAACGKWTQKTAGLF